MPLLLAVAGNEHRLKTIAFKSLNDHATHIRRRPFTANEIDALSSVEYCRRQAPRRHRPASSEYPRGIAATCSIGGLSCAYLSFI